MTVFEDWVKFVNNYRRFSSCVDAFKTPRLIIPRYELEAKQFEV